jgi:5-methylcytosine-specific restriction endonuclease McrA
MPDCQNIKPYVKPSSLSNQDLWVRTKKLVSEETYKTLEVLHHLREIERRRLYLSYGFPSLFEYAVKELKYSHSSAFRRIEAMRLIKDIPEVENKILDGSLNLTSAAQVQSFFKNQKKMERSSQVTKVTKGAEVAKLSDKHDNKLNNIDKMQIIGKIENKSTREVQKELISLNPDFIPQEKIRPLNEEKFELKIVIDEKLKLKLDKLKALMSHKNPKMNYQELMEELAELALKKLDLENQKAQRKALPAPEVKVRTSHEIMTVTQEPKAQKNNHSRYISTEIKRQIWKRDKGQCQYKDPKTNRQCCSNYFIQIDHIRAFSRGGSSQDLTNLQLLCGQHNRDKYNQEANAKFESNNNQ